MSKQAEIWNLAEASEKHRLMRQISRLSPGLYDVLIKPRRRLRSLNQNAYMHVAFVEPFRAWIAENWGEDVDHDQAFETLKLAVMEIDKVEGIPIMPSTRKLDVAEFGDFLEKAAAFLATKCDIVVIPSDLFYEMSGRVRNKVAKT
jgi:hypothetical protein